MPDFDADWLTLREPADAAARNKTVRKAVIDHINSTDKVVIADLGSGTGAMMRSLSPDITVPQDWHLIDNDRALLDAATAGEVASDTLRMRTHYIDLKRFPAGMPRIAPTLICASAFLDLVTADWVSRLVSYALMQQVPIYIALTYTGTVKFSPADPQDSAVIEAINRHQLTDKGFGPALGPDAAERLAKLLDIAHFRTIKRKSDWKLGRKHAPLQHRLLHDFAELAITTGAMDSETANAWRDRRLAASDKPRSKFVVGHLDIAAFPPRSPGEA